MSIKERIAAVLRTYDVVGKAGLTSDVEWFVLPIDGMAAALNKAEPGTGTVDYIKARQQSQLANAQAVLDAIAEGLAAGETL